MWVGESRTFNNYISQHAVLPADFPFLSSCPQMSGDACETPIIRRPAYGRTAQRESQMAAERLRTESVVSEGSPRSTKPIATARFPLRLSTGSQDRKKPLTPTLTRMHKLPEELLRISQNITRLQDTWNSMWVFHCFSSWMLVMWNCEEILNTHFDRMRAQEDFSESRLVLEKPEEEVIKIDQQKHQKLFQRWIKNKNKCKFTNNEQNKMGWVRTALHYTDINT